MANLKEIRTRLSSVKSTRQITSAMKMVAAAKLRKAQDRIVALRPYAGKLHEILLGLSMMIDDTENETSYSFQGDSKKILIIIITSNRGLCGAFNANVIREAQRIIINEYSEELKNGNLWIMAIGKKGKDHFTRLGYNIYEDHSSIFENLSFENTSEIAQKIITGFLNDEFRRIEIVYNQFRNAAVQDLTHEAYLPVEAKTSDEDISKNISDYIYEPSKEEIINELIPKSLKVQFFKAILDSFVAEHGARMTTMHMATDNATELIRELTLEYNKARQASITNEILEVVSGAEALRG